MLSWAYLARCLGFILLFVVCLLFILSPDLCRRQACPEKQRAGDEDGGVERLEERGVGAGEGHDPRGVEQGEQHPPLGEGGCEVVPGEEEARPGREGREVEALDGPRADQAPVGAGVEL